MKGFVQRGFDGQVRVRHSELGVDMTDPLQEEGGECLEE